MTRVAIFECGSNTTRLLVAEVDGRKIETLAREVAITGLGQKMMPLGILSPDAIERTAKTLEKFRSIANEFSPEKSKLVASAAARDAENLDEFAIAAQEASGQRLFVLSGQQEGTSAFVGATCGINTGDRTLVVDPGGHSTEFSYGSAGKDPQSVTSVDIGAIGITETYLHSDPPTAEELSQAVSITRDQIDNQLRLSPQWADAKDLVGVAGTLTSAAAIELGAYDRNKVHHFRLTRPAAEEIFRTLATESLALRMQNPGLDPARANLIVGGMVIVVSVLRTLGRDSILVSESDLLNGLAIDVAKN